MHTRGRPSKFTSQTVKTLLAHVRAGSPLVFACRAAGITEETLSQWRRSKPEFSERLEKAQADFVKSNLEAIQRAGRKSWQARAWLLERCHPEHFGRSRIETAVTQAPAIDPEKAQAAFDRAWRAKLAYAAVLQAKDKSGLGFDDTPHL